MRAKKRISRIAYHTVVLAVGFVMIYPLLWMVMSSFKESSTIFHTAGQLLPTQPTLENYANGWKGFSHTTFATFFKNTFFEAAMGTMIPQYLWYNQLGWINTYSPLIAEFYFATQGFFVYLLMNFMDGIPKDLDEAAKIDGCSYYSIFSRIILPLSTPAIATVAIFSFMNRWNDYMGPLLYLKRTEKYTISLALKLFCDQTSSSDYGALFAMSTLSLVPIFLIFAFMQKYLTEGVATSGIKG